MLRPALALFLLSACGITGCSSDAIGPLPTADARVLFIGNSLTTSNDLPRIVAELAGAGGFTFAYGVTAGPNMSLEDHWRGGVSRTIESAGADVVVLQQGPSSLPESGMHIVHWTGELAPVIRSAGGEPALFMVWPSVDRLHAFEAVRGSYAAAAAAVGGTFIPAGGTWLVAWESDPELALFGPDGFHPSGLGSTAAAITIYLTLLRRESGFPPCIRPTGFSVSEQLFDLLCDAAREAIRREDEAP